MEKIPPLPDPSISPNDAFILRTRSTKDFLKDFADFLKEFRRCLKDLIDFITYFLKEVLLELGGARWMQQNMHARATYIGAAASDIKPIIPRSASDLKQ